MLQRRISTIVSVLLVLLLIVGFFKLGPDFMSYPCKQAGQAMGLNWMWTFERGCFIQQPNGSWTPIDNNRQYTP